MYKQSKIWVRTLALRSAGDESDRTLLRVSFENFRERVKYLLADIGKELPGLTVHDIDHVDALWGVADQLVGDQYPLNPAEAYVLGGAFLLHDAAHVLAAYPEGKSSLKSTVQWKDSVALWCAGKEPAEASEQERDLLFTVIRQLHAARAAELPFSSWKSPTGEDDYLIEDSVFRNYYGEAIGLVAASHHWDPAEVMSRLRDRALPPPAFFHNSQWAVDTLKIALILRVADAANIDASRAPKFLFSLKNPSGASQVHWTFQSKLGRATKTKDGELRISSSVAFTSEERAAWWMAYDCAKMIDSEIRAANEILSEAGGALLDVASVQNIKSPKSFSLSVPVNGWEPIEVAPIVGNIPYLIQRLGGKSLYGDNPRAALRELIQNSMDACMAHKTINDQYVERIVIGLRKASGSWILTVEDNGIGMSRYVMTRVLLDFGKSLWSSADVAEEIPGLASASFTPIGKFGIGFYSIFMLGKRIAVVSRRYERREGDEADQWLLKFESGLKDRPALLRPMGSEKLKSQGTKVTVELEVGLASSLLNLDEAAIDTKGELALRKIVSYLAPASQIDIYCEFNDLPAVRIISANDWKTLDDKELLTRSEESGGNSKLFHIIGEDGDLLGRAAVGPRYQFSGAAVGVINGVAATRIAGLLGVVKIAGNNTDAKRVNAALGGTLASWRNWAESIRAAGGRESRSVNLALHPLIPDQDIPVWQKGGDLLSMSELLKGVASATKVLVHEGEITHEDDDDMSSSRFDDYFAVDENLIIAPDRYFGSQSGPLNQSIFPWAAGVGRIPYLVRLKEGLKAIWGGVDETDDHEIVGNANGQDIYRDVLVFERIEIEEE